MKRCPATAGKTTATNPRRRLRLTRLTGEASGARLLECCEKVAALGGKTLSLPCATDSLQLIVGQADRTQEGLPPRIVVQVL